MRRARCMLVALMGAACAPMLESDAPLPRHDPAPAYEALLAEVVSEQGYVDYEALEARRGPLDDYVAWLGRRIPRPARENAQHAFWLNAYNALVLFAVLEHGRPASVTEVDGWLPLDGSGFYFEQTFLVHGEPISLWEIRHERLRGRVMDFRDLAALQGGTAGGPPLRSELYTMRKIDGQLRRRMRAWVSDETRGVRIEKGRALFNVAFDWYAHDFASFSGAQDLCELTARYAAPEQARALRALSSKGCPHGFFPYDWSLNDAAVHEAAPTDER